MDKRSVLLIDDDRFILKMLSTYLAGAGFDVRTEQNGEHALQVLHESVFDVVITDLMIDHVDGMEILKKTKEVSSRTEVIIITGHGSIDTSVQAMKLGAFDYITKPIDLEELNIVIQKAHERQKLIAAVKNLRSQIKDYCRFDNIVATSPAMQKVLSMVKRIAWSDATVLIEGESGTGKEVIARAIHAHGGRADGPFVAINCGALPENLLESELFGHVKGAFTGAHSTKKGLFAEAHRGTIFLDEIGETTPGFQVKLLRVLQEGEIRRVGDTTDKAVDVRVLASSNTPVPRLVDSGRFRKDLYYRLSVIPLRIPPLRERREDIVPLAKYFIDRHCKVSSRQRVKLGDDVVEKLESFHWPGNVRELENAIERALILVEGDQLAAEDILIEFFSQNDDVYDFSKKSLREIERVHIQQILNDCSWNRREAAKKLGIGYNTLWRKIREYNIQQKGQ